MTKKGRSDAEGLNSRIEDKLVENLVTLQKVHTELAEKFDKLAKEISNLLALFELAAKNFTNQTPNVNEVDKEFLDKIDKLLEQNKTIAKGLTIMEEQIRSKSYTKPYVAPEQKEEEAPQQEYSPPIKTNRPLPKF